MADDEGNDDRAVERVDNAADLLAALADDRERFRVLHDAIHDDDRFRELADALGLDEECRLTDSGWVHTKECCDKAAEVLLLHVNCFLPVRRLVDKRISFHHTWCDHLDLCVRGVSGCGQGDVVTVGSWGRTVPWWRSGPKPTPPRPTPTPIPGTTPSPNLGLIPGPPRQIGITRNLCRDTHARVFAWLCVAYYHLPFLPRELVFQILEWVTNTDVCGVDQVIAEYGDCLQFETSLASGGLRPPYVEIPGDHGLALARLNHRRQIVRKTIHRNLLGHWGPNVYRGVGEAREEGADVILRAERNVYAVPPENPPVVVVPLDPIGILRRIYEEQDIPVPPRFEHGGVREAGIVHRIDEEAHIELLAGYGRRGALHVENNNPFPVVAGDPVRWELPVPPRFEHGYAQRIGPFVRERRDPPDIFIRGDIGEMGRARQPDPPRAMPRVVGLDIETEIGTTVTGSTGGVMIGDHPPEPTEDRLRAIKRWPRRAVPIPTRRPKHQPRPHRKGQSRRGGKGGGGQKY